jgi:hypothetical protein
MVIKTREDERLISDLAEIFDNLRKFKMKLNPEKCTFCVPSENYSDIWSSVVALILI